MFGKSSTYILDIYNSISNKELHIIVIKIVFIRVIKIRVIKIVHIFK